MKKGTMNYLKQFLVSLMYGLMTLTFVLSPIPPIKNNLSVVYAQEAGCEENVNQDGTPGIYRVGCEFNEDLAKSDVKASYELQENSVAKIVEQYIGIIFALVMVSSFGYKYTMRSVVDCPMNRTASVTLLMTQLASLALIIGEIRTNLKFREASKKAVDKTFGAKENENTGDKEQDEKNRSSNDKQLETYETLAQVYDDQTDALRGKKVASILAEVAYLSATVIETSAILGYKSLCKASKQTTTATLDGVLVNLEAAASAATSEASARAASYDEPGAAVCTALAGAIEAEVVKKQGEAKKIEAEAKKKLAEAEAEDAKDSGKLIKLWNGMINALKSGASKVTSFFGKVGSFIGKQAKKIASEIKEGIKSATEKEVAEKADDAITDGTVSSTSSCASSALYKEAKTLFKATKQTPVYCCGGDLTAKDADIDSWNTTDTNKQIQNRLKAMAGKMNSAGALGVLEKIGAFIAQNLTKDAAQFETYDEYPTISIPLVGSSIMDKKTDIYYGSEDESLPSEPSEATSFNSLNIYKEITYSFLNRVAFEMVYKNLDSSKPEHALKQIAKTEQQIQRMIDEQFTETKINLELANLKNRVEKEKLQPSELFIQSQIYISKLGESLISSAHATSDIWKELLNIGVKLFALQLFLKGFVREYGLVKPRNRAILWGLMSAINAGLIKFQSEAIDESEKRADAVRAEARRFAESAAKKMDRADEDDEKRGEGSGGELNLERFTPLAVSPGVRGAIDLCATVTQRGVNRAPCPSKIPDSLGSTTSLSPSQRNLTGVNFQRNLSDLRRLSGNVVTGAVDTDNGLTSANIEALGGNRPAIRKLAENLAEKLDRQNGDIDSKGNQRKGRVSLLKSLKDSFKFSTKQRNSTPLKPEEFDSINATANTGALAEIKKIEDKENKKGSIFTPPSFDFKAPKSNSGSLDFSFGDESESITTTDDTSENKAEGFASFDIDDENISPKKDVSIFKLISNRYLLSYPILLEEKKKK